MSVATGFIQILQVNQTQQLPQLQQLAHPIISYGLGVGGAFGESFQQ
jgi:hypothetical protein